MAHNPDMVGEHLRFAALVGVHQGKTGMMDFRSK